MMVVGWCQRWWSDADAGDGGGSGDAWLQRMSQHLVFLIFEQVCSASDGNSDPFRT